MYSSFCPIITLLFPIYSSSERVIQDKMTLPQSTHCKLVFFNLKCSYLLLLRNSNFFLQVASQRSCLAQRNWNSNEYSSFTFIRALKQSDNKLCRKAPSAFLLALRCYNIACKHLNSIKDSVSTILWLCGVGSHNLCEDNSADREISLVWSDIIVS